MAKRRRPARCAQIATASTRLGIAADKVQFDVAANDYVTELHAIGRNQTIEAGVNEFARLAALLGAPPPQMYALARDAEQTHLFEPLRQIFVQSAATIDPLVRVDLLPGDFDPADPQHDHIRVRVSVFWRDVERHAPVRRQPISPPPGYEQYSMAPESPAPQAPPSATPIVASAVTTPSATEAPPATAEASVSATEPEVRHHRSRSGVRKIVVAVIVVAVLASVAVFWISRKRGKAPPGPV